MSENKYLSRKFLLVVGVVALASAALFMDKATFVEWSATAGGFVLAYITGNVVQKKKTNE